MVKKSVKPFTKWKRAPPLLCHSLSHTHPSFLSFLLTKVVSKEVGSQLWWRSFDLHYSHLATTLISICSNLATAWVFRSRIETGFFPPDLGFWNDLWIVVVAGFVGCSEGLTFLFPTDLWIWVVRVEVGGFMPNWWWLPGFRWWVEWWWVCLCRTGGGC